MNCRALQRFGNGGTPRGHRTPDHLVRRGMLSHVLRLYFADYLKAVCALYPVSTGNSAEVTIQEVRFGYGKVRHSTIRADRDDTNHAKGIFRHNQRGN
jgi:hypothetical protein